MDMHGSVQSIMDMHGSVPSASMHMHSVIIEELAAVGLLPYLWPPEHILMGMCVWYVCMHT